MRVAWDGKALEEAVRQSQVEARVDTTFIERTWIG